jgi:hypothetical protein
MAPAVDDTARRDKHLFRLAYGVLALAFWLSVAGFVVLLSRPNHSQPLVWSKWQPKAEGLTGAHEIAQRIGPRYQSANGTQLVAIQEHGPSVQGLHLEAVGVRRLGQSGQIDPYIGLFRTDRTLIYAFCGLQTNCSIGSDASVQEQVLRREALELSLYAFKYLKNVDQVVSLVQTVKDGGTSAVFLRKDDLRAELEHPLHETLPLQAPRVASPIGKREGKVVDALTLQNTFPAHYESLPDGDAILVLDVAAQPSS